MSTVPKLKIRRDDKVVVISGKDKGKTGVVRKVFPSRGRVIVEGVNRVTKHVAPSRQEPEGGRKLIEAPIHVSNVAIIDPASQKPTRVGYKTDASGKKVRFAKKSGDEV